jgi:hypothetical protein
VGRVDWGIESAWARTALAILERSDATDAQRGECGETVRKYLERLEGVANLDGDQLKEATPVPQTRKREVAAVFEESSLRIVVPLWDTAWLVDLATQASVLPMRLVLRSVVGDGATVGPNRFTVEEAAPVDVPAKSSAARKGDHVLVVTLYGLELDEEAARFTIRSQLVVAASDAEPPPMMAKDILAALGSGRVRVGLRRMPDGGTQVHFEDAPEGEKWADPAHARA